MRRSRWLRRQLLPAALALAGCRSGDNGSGLPAGGQAIQQPSPSGNRQTGTVRRPLASPLRVPVARDGAPATVRLTIGSGARFIPSSLTVAVNTTIVFQWVSGTHDINTFGSPAFRSFTPPVYAPASQSVTLAIPGTYQFFCSVHGSETSGMRGTIVVQ